jgi:hypothetical protein
MKKLFRLLMLALLVFAGGVVAIHFLYRVSWRESLEIADQFVQDLIG